MAQPATPTRGNVRTGRRGGDEEVWMLVVRSGHQSLIKERFLGGSSSAGVAFRYRLQENLCCHVLVLVKDALLGGVLTRQGNF